MVNKSLINKSLQGQVQPAADGQDRNHEAPSGATAGTSGQILPRL